LLQYLKDRGWHCEAFHAGLNAADKRTIQEHFISANCRLSPHQCLRMGIDKKDIRLVLHAHISGSLESYLQEAGRPAATCETPNACCSTMKRYRNSV